MQDECAQSVVRALSARQRARESSVDVSACFERESGCPTGGREPEAAARERLSRNATHRRDPLGNMCVLHVGLLLSSKGGRIIRANPELLSRTY